MSTINNIKTQGYFIKRMKDSGYIVDRVYSNYNSTDNRVWTVVIDPGNASIFCTCIANEDPEEGAQLGPSTFELFDGGRFVPGKFRVKTSSFEIIVENLVKWGINNKAWEYNERLPIAPAQVK